MGRLYLSPHSWWIMREARIEKSTGLFAYLPPVDTELESIRLR